MSERETVKLRIPDTGNSWRRWAGNFLAWPRYGMHAVWRAEARRWAHKIAERCPREVELVGHSRGGVVAVYTAIYLSEHLRHTLITLRITGPPRAWFGRRWATHYERYLSLISVDCVAAFGDPVLWLPPFWRTLESLRMVGPYRRVYPRAHYPDYISKWDNK